MQLKCGQCGAPFRDANLHLDRDIAVCSACGGVQRLPGPTSHVAERLRRPTGGHARHPLQLRLPGRRGRCSGARPYGVHRPQAVDGGYHPDRRPSDPQSRRQATRHDRDSSLHRRDRRRRLRLLAIGLRASLASAQIPASTRPPPVRRTRPTATIAGEAVEIRRPNQSSFNSTYSGRIRGNSPLSGLPIE